MSAAFERFLGGEGRLAELLKGLPAYEPSPETEQAIMHLLRTQQQSLQTAYTDELPGFEPPPGMDERFIAEARRTDAAQEIRRAALFNELAAGKKPADVLGAVVSEQTESWLKHQAAIAAAPKAARRTVHRPWFGLTWRDIGLATSAALVATLVTQVYLESAAPIPQHTTVSKAKEAVPDTTVLAAVASSQVNVAESPLPEAQPKLAEAGKPADRQAPLAFAKHAGQAEVQRATASPIDEDKGVLTESSKKTAEIQPTAPEQRLSPEPQKSELADASVSSARSMSAAAPPASIARDEKPAAPAPSMKAPSVTMDEDPAKRQTFAAKALKSARNGAEALHSCLIVSLKYDPAVIAQHLEMTRCGQIVRLRTANPDSAAAHEWAEGFRAALPDERRITSLPVEKDLKVPLDLISIDALPIKEE